MFGRNHAAHCLAGISLVHAYPVFFLKEWRGEFELVSTCSQSHASCRNYRVNMAGAAPGTGVLFGFYVSDSRSVPPEQR